MNSVEIGNKYLVRSKQGHYSVLTVVAVEQDASHVLVGNHAGLQFSMSKFELKNSILQTGQYTIRNDQCEYRAVVADALFPETGQVLLRDAVSLLRSVVFAVNLLAQTPASPLSDTTPPQTPLIVEDKKEEMVLPKKKLTLSEIVDYLYKMELYMKDPSKKADRRIWRRVLLDYLDVDNCKFLLDTDIRVNQLSRPYDSELIFDLARKTALRWLCYLRGMPKVKAFFKMLEQEKNVNLTECMIGAMTTILELKKRPLQPHKIMSSIKKIKKAMAIYYGTESNLDKPILIDDIPVDEIWEQSDTLRFYDTKNENIQKAIFGTFFMYLGWQLEQKDKSSTKRAKVGIKLICGACKEVTATPHQCGHCDAVVYCGQKCANRDWQKHKMNV